MAKPGSRRTPRSRRRLVIALALLALVVAALVWFRAPIAGYGQTSAAYAARVACSCRYAGGRSLEDCEKDKLAGMELVQLSEDAAEKSVTATFPLVASETARWRDGYGCVLAPWDD